jgi:hypothetical protein
MVGALVIMGSAAVEEVTRKLVSACWPGLRNANRVYVAPAELGPTSELVTHVATHDVVQAGPAATVTTPADHCRSLHCGITEIMETEPAVLATFAATCAYVKVVADGTDEI